MGLFAGRGCGLAPSCLGSAAGKGALDSFDQFEVCLKVGSYGIQVKTNDMVALPGIDFVKYGFQQDEGVATRPGTKTKRFV
jgi:hypothetical protein